jgi:hypothetical protein
LIISAVRSGAKPRLRPLRNILLFTLASVSAILAGCGSTVKPEIGPIEFTTATGAGAPAVKSLAENGQVYLVATVTHDDQFLGVSWTVDCGSALPPSSGTIDTSCGTLNPAQTMSGPVPAYPSTGIITTYSAPPSVPKGSTVTITAHATSLPSVTSSIELTIVKTQGVVAPAPAPKVSPAAAKS